MAMTKDDALTLMRRVMDRVELDGAIHLDACADEIRAGWELIVARDVAKLSERAAKTAPGGVLNNAFSEKIDGRPLHSVSHPSVAPLGTAPVKTEGQRPVWPTLPPYAYPGDRMTVELIVENGWTKGQLEAHCWAEDLATGEWCYSPPHSPPRLSERATEIARKYGLYGYRDDMIIADDVVTNQAASEDSISTEKLRKDMAKYMEAITSKQLSDAMLYGQSMTKTYFIDQYLQKPVAYAVDKAKADADRTTFTFRLADGKVAGVLGY